MKISFVIPAYNEEAHVGACIQSILDHWTPDFLEIIVVNNASTDRTAEKAQEFARKGREVRVVAESRKGTNWARERGLVEAKGDLVAFLDADVRMPDRWPVAVQKEFAANPKLVCLSGPFHYYDLPFFKKLLAEGLWWLAPVGYHVMGFAALGANMVIRRMALLGIGGFDTDIVFYGDDTNTARRLAKVGKVKFSMKFFILGSGRRLLKEGIWKTNVVYVINFFVVGKNHRPRTNGYKELR
jgi:glycosyltransferase involved in cell wall biosynthesis